MKTLKEIQNENPYASVFTIEEFIDHVRAGGITNYDGCGYYHDGVNETNVHVNADLGSSLVAHRNTYPYVCWYNN